MRWKDKIMILKQLGEVSLHMRKLGDWYVSHSYVEVKDGNILCSKYGRGATPQEAVEDHWKKLTELEFNQYIVIHAYDREKRQAYVWSGFMWKLVNEDDMLVKLVYEELE